MAVVHCIPEGTRVSRHTQDLDPVARLTSQQLYLTTNTTFSELSPHRTWFDNIIWILQNFLLTPFFFAQILDFPIANYSFGLWGVYLSSNCVLTDVIYGSH
jgi:hypothetical protein